MPVGTQASVKGVPQQYLLDEIGADPVTVALEVAGGTPTTIAIDDDEALEPIATALCAAGHTVLRPHEATYRGELPRASLGITGCAAAIAETGTLMLTFDAAHPRITSLLPRDHLAIVDPSDLVATLGDALARVPTPAPSALTFVTGPSRSADIEPIARDAIAIGAHCLWMQLGVVNEAAAALARAAGLEVVMDRCVKIEHARLFGGLGWAGVNTGIVSARRPRQLPY